MIGRSGKQRWIGLAVLAVTFLAGGIAGAAVREVMADDPPQQQRSGEREGGRRRGFPYDALSVTAEQRPVIEAVLERRRLEMDSVWREYEPRMDAIVDSTRTEINQVLTAEQQQKFEELRAKRRQMNKEHDSEKDGDAHSERGGDLL
jgi:Spy/CpxP family protein refolding chaperone